MSGTTTPPAAPASPNPLDTLKQTCSIFTPSVDLPTLQTDRLLTVASRFFPDANLSDPYLWLKLTAAETEMERQLRTLFSPREILPSGPTFDAESAALVATGATVVEEPGYDYEPALFLGNTWGDIELRHRPVIAVHSIIFAYPSTGDNFYQVPNDWIRLDKKYGRISLVPSTNTSVVLPLNAYLLSAIGAGTTVPFMIAIRYSAGNPNLRVLRPDIVDTIFRMAVMSIIDDNFIPSSGSESIDGLSQSNSFDPSKYQAALDAKIAKIQSELNGIRMLVC